MTAAEAEQKAADEGLTLLNSESNSTGYKGVALVADRRSTSTPYRAEVRRRGKSVILGKFATKEEAALEFARSPEGRAAVAASQAAAAAPPQPVAAAAAAAGQPMGPPPRGDGGGGAAAAKLPIQLARISPDLRQRKRQANTRDDGHRHASGERQMAASLKEAQPRSAAAWVGDDDMVAAARNPFAARRTKSLAYQALTSVTGCVGQPIIIDATDVNCKLNLTEARMMRLKKWHHEFITPDAPITNGNKRSKLVKPKSDAFKALWDILEPVYGTLGFELYEANAILYAKGEESYIYPHMDSHHHFKERVTIVLELEGTSDEHETLHFSVDGREMRMPVAEEKEQLLSVATSSDMLPHYAHVTGKAERRSLALFMYLKDFEPVLKQGEELEPQDVYPSGELQALHDARVKQLLIGDLQLAMRELEPATTHALQRIVQLAAADTAERSAKRARSSCSGSVDAAGPSSSATQMWPPSLSASGLGNESALRAEIRCGCVNPNWQAHLADSNALEAARRACQQALWNERIAAKERWRERGRLARASSLSTQPPPMAARAEEGLDVQRAGVHGQPALMYSYDATMSEAGASAEHVDPMSDVD